MKLLKKRSIIFFVAINITLFFVCSFIYGVGGYGKVLNEVKKQCNGTGIGTDLVLAIIKTESNFNEKAVSKKSAVGLMQLTNSTAKYIANLVGFNEEIDLFDSRVNIYLGVQYLKYLANKFSDENTVICAYNAGETKVKEWIDSNGVIEIKTITYKETKAYLTKVKRRQKLYKILIN
ncbi:MAG: lytic transglycosylase domain-containing protein [Clostridia bacterium]|nr:lytic transglycosylase domain-containing protein [Clostridia bacterium]